MKCTQVDFAPNQTWLTRGGWVERILTVYPFMPSKPITCASGRLYTKEGRINASGAESPHDLVRLVDLERVLSEPSE